MTSPIAEFDKFFPPNFELDTTRVLIRPMKPEDLEAFLALSRSADTWKYFYKDLENEEEMRQWVADALREKEERKRMPFTIIDKDTREICGSTSYGNISFFDRRLEIGWSWLGPEYIGMGVNKPVKFALLSYAFEVMKMERVEAKTDVLSERAKAALLKVGMIPEGVLRNHTQMHSGRRRDTIYFSILKSEWPERKSGFFAEML
jgi:RimJ/RimL family protein N-acetyltransferase